MARETAKERNARMNKEREGMLARRREAYPQRFREVVALTLEENFELTKVDPTSGAYHFYDRDESKKYVVFDSFGEAGQSEWPLECLETEAKFKAEKREEEQRRYEVKLEALKKLNQVLNLEERELLGL